MVSFATDFAKSILEKLVDATVAESKYICCFTCIADDFEKEKETLKVKSDTVKEYVQETKNKGERIRNDVTYWQEQAEKLIKEDTKTKVTCLFGWCPNCKWRYIRGKDLQSKSEEIKRLINETDNCISSGVGIHRDVAGVEYHSSQDYISFQSRELSYKNLWDALTNDKNYMTGLQGMGGTGKTTLAKEVGKELKKCKKFDHVIDTTISYTPDRKKIQDDIAGPLGVSFKDCTESERPKRLCSRLIDDEKILLILDDVWGDINFEEIGIPLKDNHNGCKILVTTRDLKICKRMKCDSKIQLDLLSEDDAWILFKRHSGISQSSSKSILDMGRKIVKECKGLPVAIAVIASSLNGELGHEEWMLALESLQKSTSQHGDDENLDKIHQCLKYSYDNLRNEKAKRLFLLCSLFPEDEQLSVEILTRCSIGASIVEETDNNYHTCRNQVIVTANTLIDSCLLLKTEEGSVKMHDLVREVALTIASKEIQAKNISSKNKKSLDETAYNPIYLVWEGSGMDEISLVCDRSKLEILIVYMDEDIIYSENVLNSFFKNMIRLQVLYLSRKTWTSRHWKGNISLSLSHSVKSLINIRSLIVEGFDLGDISILGYLEGLETLDLIECSMNELPCEIEKLKKLKLLLLKKCYIERNNPFKVIENCSLLEELHFICNMMSTIRQQNVNLFKFKRFRIELFQVRHRSLMNSLCLENGDEIFPEATLKHLAQAAECLHIREGGWRNLIPTIVLPKDEGTLNVVNLNLKSMPQLECLVDNKHIDSRMKDVFSKLVEIELGEMENLRELCSGSFPVQLFQSLETLLISNCTHLQGILFKSKLSLCNLKSLILRSCPMLTSLFHLSNSQSLILLENLEICSYAELKYIFDFGGDNDKRSIGLKFLNLKFLYIGSCPKLDFILPVVAAQDVPKLEFIKIDNCAELKYIFYPYQCEHDEQDLPQELKDTIFAMLKEVVLQDLPKFVDIFPKCDKSMCSSKERPCSKEESKTIPESFPIKCNVFAWCLKYRPKLRNTRTSLNSCDHLQDYSLPLVHDSQVNDMIGREMIAWLVNVDFKSMPQMPCFSLQLITILQIRDCEKMKVIFSASMLTCLPQLQLLAIIRCKELEQIIDEDTSRNQIISFLSNLKVLGIEECNNLKCVFPVFTSIILPKLEILFVGKASMLEEVFKCGSDKKVEIPNLKVAAFVELPSLCKDIDDFHAVKDRLVLNCPKLSLTSTLTPERMEEIIDGIEGTDQASVCTRETLNYVCENYVERSQNQDSSEKLMEEFPIENVWSEWPTSEGSKTIFEEVNTSNEIIELSSCSVSGKDKGEKAINSTSDVNIEHAITKDVANGDFRDSFNSSITPSETSSPGFEEINLPIKELLQGSLHNHYEDDHDISNENLSANATEEFLVETKVQEISGRELISSQEIKKNVKEGTESTSGNTITLPISSKSVTSIFSPLVTPEWKIDSQKGSEGQIAIPSFSMVNTELATTKNVGHGGFQETYNYGVTHSNTNASGSNVSNKHTKGALQSLLNDISESSKAQEIISQNSTAEASKDFPNETNQSVHANIADYNQPENGIQSNKFILAETKTKKTLVSEQENVENYRVLEKPLIAISPTDSELMRRLTCQIPSYAPLYKAHSSEIKRSVEEGSKSADGKTPAIPIVSESDNWLISPLVTSKSKIDQEENGEGQISIPSCGDGHFQKTSKFVVTHSLSNVQGNLSHQITEDSSVVLTVRREIEQLVFNKHLALENLSLLTDFLVKHPSVHLSDKKLSDRYKGFAYTCLAEFLKFLQTRSVLDVLGSNRSKFVELLQDVRSCGFNKDWLDDVERRALFHEDPFQKILDSKRALIQQLEDIKHGMIQHLEHLKHQVEEQKAHVIKVMATLNTPLGY